jgi:hypothetical protein
MGQTKTSHNPMEKNAQACQGSPSFFKIKNQTKGLFISLTQEQPKNN